LLATADIIRMVVGVKICKYAQNINNHKKILHKKKQGSNNMQNPIQQHYAGYEIID